MFSALLRDVQLLVVLELDWLSTMALSVTSRYFYELCTSSWGSKLSFHIGYEVDLDDAEYMFRRLTTCGSPRCYDTFSGKYIAIPQRNDIVEVAAQGNAVWAITTRGQCNVHWLGVDEQFTMDKVYTAIVNSNFKTLLAAALLTGELYVVRFRIILNVKWVKKATLDKRVAYFVCVTSNTVCYVALDGDVVRIEFNGSSVPVTSIITSNILDVYTDHSRFCFVKTESWGIYRLWEGEVDTEEKGTVKKFVSSGLDYFLSDVPVTGMYKVHISTDTTRTMTGISGRMDTIARLLHNGTLLIHDVEPERMLDDNVIALYDHAASDYLCYIKK